MIRQFAKYMKAGKAVESSWTGEEYLLVEDMDNKKGCVRVVGRESWDQYMGLDEVRRKDLEMTLKIADVKPCNEVKFLDLNGGVAFEVKDLERVRVDGSVARVVYLDTEHFSFVDGVPLSGCFGIREFAFLCQKNDIAVEPFVQPFVWGGR